MSNTAKLLKIADHSVYGNLVSGIIYSIFTVLFFSKLTYRNSNKTDINITYQITYFLLAAMFLVFTIEHIFKYNFDKSHVTLKMLLFFMSLCLVYLNTGISWTKTYYEEKGGSEANTAKKIQYMNGVFSLFIGLLFATPALLRIFTNSGKFIEEIPWIIFGVGYMLLGCIEVYFSSNPNGNRYLYLIPFFVLNIAFISFVIKIALNYTTPIAALRDFVMALICGKILTVLLKEVVYKENKIKVINWVHFFILFAFSVVHISIFRLNPDRP